MYITEIKESIQGEGRNAGFLTTFIRTYGCNLKCAWCDAKYACEKENKQKISLKRIMEMVNQLGNKYVCITGGEPLLQTDALVLAYELCYFNYIVNIETNGSVLIDKDDYQRSYIYTMDIKCPSSGMSEKNKYVNLGSLISRDEVKFVIADYTDYLFAKAVLRQYSTKASIIFSPMFSVEGKSNGNELAKWMLDDNLQNVRLGVQLHKILGCY